MLSRLKGNPWAALTILSAGLFMTLLDVTIVNIAIPQLIDSLDASLDEALWVINAYVLVLGVLLIPAGRLGDIYGPRNVYVVGTALFTLASAGCGLAQTPAQLIAARAFQGVGAALLTPQSLAIVLPLFPPERRGSAFAVNGVIAGVASLAGPILGGVIVTHWDWRGIFFVNLPVGALAIAATLLIVPDLRPGRRHRLDITGVAIVTLGILLVSVGLIDGQRYDWGQVWSFVSIPLILVAGVGVLIGFVFHQRAKQGGGREPLVPFALFRDRNYTIANFVGGALHLGMIGMFLPTTIYMQSVLGYSALEAGLFSMPISLVSMVCTPFVGRLVDRFGGKWILLAGLATFAAGIALFALMAEVDSTGWTFMPSYFVTGLGVSAVFVPLFALAMGEVPPSLAGAASGVLNTTRQLGSVFGGAAVGALLQHELAADLHDEATAR
ncbi:MAG TPA: DHA2 family efflux MFS transporter permease subunit, partial [Solirubrobacter sp.]|nr:DHA2 family efflux MFS transporter permease subunit [Solirubrobacter sp.]